MKNFSLFKMPMKKLCKAGLSFFILLILFSSCRNNAKLDNYHKQPINNKDSVKYESVKIQTH